MFVCFSSCVHFFASLAPSFLKKSWLKMHNLFWMALLMASSFYLLDHGAEMEISLVCSINIGNKTGRGRGLTSTHCTCIFNLPNLSEVTYKKGSVTDLLHLNLQGCVLSFGASHQTSHILLEISLAKYHMNTILKQMDFFLGPAWGWIFSIFKLSTFSMISWMVSV